MVILQGKSVFGGVAIGKIQFFKRDEIQIKRRHVDDPEAEIRRFRTAKEKALSELQQLYDKALTDVGEANAMIFEAHQLMLEDPDYNDSVENIINTQKVNAEYAIGVTSDNYAAIFEAMDDAYMQGRAADVKDVSTRVLRILARTWKDKMLTDEPFILAAGELYPSETVKFDKSKILGFVTRYGTINSHTAVLARTKGIPSVIGLGESLKKEYEGKTIIIDGFIMTNCILAASKLHPEVLEYCVFGHQGDEAGHKSVLEALHAKPLLNLGLRLGEGTGAICAYPIIESAIRMINEMSSFKQAAVTKYF